MGNEYTARRCGNRSRHNSRRIGEAATEHQMTAATHNKIAPPCVLRTEERVVRAVASRERAQEASCRLQWQHRGRVGHCFPVSDHEGASMLFIPTSRLRRRPPRRQLQALKNVN